MTFAEFAFKAMSVPFKMKGRGYTGWDCWGLVFAAYRDVLGIAIPSYHDDYKSVASNEELEQLITSERDSSWIEVTEQKHRPGDLVLLRIEGRSTHVGIVVVEGMMLHTDIDVGTAYESYRGTEWKDRIVGVWRYAGC